MALVAGSNFAAPTVAMGRSPRRDLCVARCAAATHGSSLHDTSFLPHLAIESKRFLIAAVGIAQLGPGKAWWRLEGPDPASGLLPHHSPKRLWWLVGRS
jgi:hypothetical protein